MTYLNTDGSTVSTSRSTWINGGINAFGFQIRFQSTDFQSSTSSTSSSSTPPGQTSPPGPSQTDRTPNNSSGENGGGQSISAGQAAGIGVGVAIGVLLMVGVAAFVFWRKRRAARHGTAASSAPSYQPVKGVAAKEGLATRGELHGQSSVFNELDASHTAPHYHPGPQSHTTHELDGAARTYPPPSHEWSGR
jgi:hypothetical protein